MGEVLPLYSILPFVGLLLSIALGPLLLTKFWHDHFGKVSTFWAVLTAVPIIIAYQGLALHQFLHVLVVDYIPFIILLWSLYTISGGMVIHGNLMGNLPHQYHDPSFGNCPGLLDGHHRSIPAFDPFFS